MKNRVLLLVIIIVFSTCSNWNQKELTPEEKQNMLEIQNDKLQLVFDSIMSIQIELPQLIDSTFIAIECLEQFNQLARETEGELKIVSNSKFVSRVIVDIIESNLENGSDLMIVIDNTGSMSDDIGNIKKGLSQILESLNKFEDIRFSVATYGDRNVDNKSWFSFRSFEGDFIETSKYIEEIKITGGGDLPESVYDGIYEAFQQEFWDSNTKRMVLLLGDAPSLDSTKSVNTIEDIIEISTNDKISMNFYPIVLSPQDLGFVMDVPKMQNLTFIESIYPNPCRGKFTMKLNQLGKFRFDIYNQSGVRVKEGVLETNLYTDDLYDHPDGLYVIRVFDDNKNFDTRKIILTKNL